MKPASVSVLRTARQSGVVLLEALLAILVFSIGILALAGLEANALKQVSNGKYRSDASLLANQLISEMWIGERSTATLVSQYSSAPAGDAYATWKAQVIRELPGASANPPTVTVIDVAGSSAAASHRQATVTVHWKLPSEAAGDPAHRYLLVAQIK
jgi:type IV pilus assembly protein PilV